MKLQEDADDKVIEQGISKRKDINIVNGEIVEFTYDGKDSFYSEYRKEVLRERKAEEERLAKERKIEQERLAKIEAERVEKERLAKLEAEKNERIRLAKVAEQEKVKKNSGKGQVIASNDTPTRSSGIESGRKYRVETLTVTAYAPYDNQSGICNDGNPNKTSTGSKPARGTVAVNPKRFPYGTEFYIEGYGSGTALDTGGAMRQNSSKIDIFVQTSKQAKAWGVRKVNVKIYEN